MSDEEIESYIVSWRGNIENERDVLKRRFQVALERYSEERNTLRIFSEVLCRIKIEGIFFEEIAELNEYILTMVRRAI